MIHCDRRAFVPLAVNGVCVIRDKRQGNVELRMVGFPCTEILFRMLISVISTGELELPVSAFADLLIFPVVR